METVGRKAQSENTSKPTSQNFNSIVVLVVPWWCPAPTSQ